MFLRVSNGILIYPIHVLYALSDRAYFIPYVQTACSIISRSRKGSPRMLRMWSTRCDCLAIRNTTNNELAGTRYSARPAVNYFSIYGMIPLFVRRRTWSPFQPARAHCRIRRVASPFALPLSRFHYRNKKKKEPHAAKSDCDDYWSRINSILIPIWFTLHHNRARAIHLYLPLNILY